MFDGVLIGCGVMVLVCQWFPPSGVVGTFAPIVTSSFVRSVMSFCGWLAKTLMTFCSCTSSLVFNQVSILIVECSLFVEG